MKGIIRQILLFTIFIASIPLVFCIVSKNIFLETKSADVFPVLKASTYRYPLMIENDTPIESGEIIFKYKDDIQNKYLYIDNVTDNDWIACVPLLKNVDSSEWNSYNFLISNINPKKIKDVGEMRNNRTDQYSISDEILRSLHSLSEEYIVGKVLDIIVFRSDAANNLSVKGVWRVVWSVKFNESASYGIGNFKETLRKLKEGVKRNGFNILNESPNEINSKYAILKDELGNFKTLQKAEVKNNVNILTSDSRKNPLNFVEIPDKNDYSVVKISDFDKDSNSWEPTLEGIPWDEKIEWEMWKNKMRLEHLKRQEVYDFLKSKNTDSNSESSIYDIVHKNAINDCDFVKRVAIVGQNDDAKNAISDIKSTDENSLKSKYSDIFNNYVEETEPKPEEPKKDEETKDEPKKDEKQDNKDDKSEKIDEKKDKNKIVLKTGTESQEIICTYEPKKNEHKNTGDSNNNNQMLSLWLLSILAYAMSVKRIKR